MFLVEQNAFHALRAYVMVNGAITSAAPVSSFLAEPRGLRAAYLEGGRH